MKTASGIKRFQEEKNYGAWFNQLFELVKTRESCQPEQAIEPGEQSSDSPNQSLNLDDSAQDFFIPVKKDARKSSHKEKQSQEILDLVQKIAEKDPMNDFLTFMREQEERDRKHELAIISLIMNQQTMQPQQQLMNNYNNTAYMNPGIQEYVPQSNNVINHMAGRDSCPSYVQEVNSVNQSSEKTFMTL